MDNIEEFIDFVKNQMSFHERQALRYEGSPKRKNRHVNTVNKFRELYEFLNKQSSENIYKLKDKTNLSLSWEELEGLPEELLQELSITESDKLDYSIVSLIEQNNGIVTLDQLLVAIYKSRQEIVKRSSLNARLYRMVQKGMIYSVPKKKGVYSSYPVIEDVEDNT